MASDQRQFTEVVDDARKLRVALDVCGFTVHLLAVMLDGDSKKLAASQIEAAHEAYRAATGEPSWDQMISERIARREERDHQCESK